MIDKTRKKRVLFFNGSFKININREDIMKKFLSVILAFVLVLSAFGTVFADNSYGTYTKISGKIERDGDGDIKAGDKFKVNIAVNFNDSTPIEKVTAFHIVGNCSDNLKISGFDFCDTSKKSSNISSKGMENQTINYTSVAFQTDPFVEADADGYGRLIWIEFEAVKSGSATIHLDDSYIRSAVEDDPQNNRCLSADDLTVTVSSDGSDNSDNSDNSGNGGSSSGGSSRPSKGGSTGGSTGTVSGGDSKNDTNTDVKTDENTDTKTDDGKTEEVLHSFADVDKNHWGYAFANDLFEKKIISGAGTNENGEVMLNPDMALTREEAVKIAVSAANIALSDSFELAFADKDAISDWAAAYVFAGFEKGILKGYEDGTFKPKGAITREELVKVLLGAFGIEVDENADVSAFTDAESIKWSAPYIAKAVEKGIIKGYDDGSVKPQNTVTRIEAITMFGRAMSAK